MPLCYKITYKHNRKKTTFPAEGKCTPDGCISNFRRWVVTPTCRTRYRSVSHRPESCTWSEKLKCAHPIRQVIQMAIYLKYGKNIPAKDHCYSITAYGKRQPLGGHSTFCL